MFARNGSSVGVMRCPRPCRARKATRAPSSVPMMKLSEGMPNGVSTPISCASVNPSIQYKPLPPMIPICAFSIIHSRLLILLRIDSAHLSARSAADPGDAVTIQSRDIDDEVGGRIDRIFQCRVFQRAFHFLLKRLNFELFGLPGVYEDMAGVNLFPKFLFRIGRRFWA